MGGFLAVSGLCVGSLLTYLNNWANWWRDESLAAGAMVADTYDLIWGDKTHRELQVHLMKVRIRLQQLGVPRSQILNFEETANACWRNGHRAEVEALEVGDDDARGVESELLDRFEAGVRIVSAYLRPGSAIRPGEDGKQFRRRPVHLVLSWLVRQSSPRR